MKSDSIHQMFLDVGMDPARMEINIPYDVDGLEILSYEDGQPAFKKVKKVVKKNSADAYRVQTKSGEGFMCSPEHRVFCKFSPEEAPEYRYAADLVEVETLYLLTQENGWQPGEVYNTFGSTEILDLEVEGTNSYYSNGILSHNTMFGDPTITPGGKALPFYASIRVRLQGGAFIYEDPNNKSAPPIGINVEAKTIKNRMTAPHRRANFRVIFGVGIDDSEEVFDVCREWSDAQEKEEVPILLDGHIVRVLGAQSWKTITVSDSDGVVIAEDKFYKKDFKKIRHDPRFKKWIDLLLEEAMVIKKKNEGPEEGEVESEQ